MRDEDNARKLSVAGRANVCVFARSSLGDKSVDSARQETQVVTTEDGNFYKKTR